VPLLRFSYPVTEEVEAALARFPEIGKVIPIPSSGTSSLHIIRLLGNRHYPQVDQLLAFIDRELPGSGDIGRTTLKQSNPFQFRARLAELFIFAHVRARLGSAVRPAEDRKHGRRPEMECSWDDLAVKLEVYSPTDLMAFQLIEEYMPAIFKYLDVLHGFIVDIAIDAIGNPDEATWYPHTFPKPEEVVAWLDTVRPRAERLLGRPMISPGEHLRLLGPGGSTGLRVKVRGVFADPNIRQIIFTTGTRSTDARLIFEFGGPEDTARSSWGQKLKAKMQRRQAGIPAPGRIRILVVNFAGADTGWPDFFGWPDIAKRIEDTVRLIAGQLTASLPYDLVLPARLDLECSFGNPVWLDAALEGRGVSFVEAAGLTHACAARRAHAQDHDLDALPEVAPDSVTEESVEG
jgi:hypothetical protein